MESSWKEPYSGDVNVSYDTKNGLAPEEVEGEASFPGTPALQEPRVFVRRWFMLALFCFYSLTNAAQWIQYSVIANIIKSYYGLDSFLAVDFLSMVYMIAYIPLIFPATWLLDKKGLRPAILLGSFGNALAAWIKCASVSPDKFWVTMLGQTVAAISQIFVLGIPAKLAAVWFGPNEVSTACAIGVFGNQLGVAVGFLLPPIIVPNADRDTVGLSLSYMFYGMAAITSAIFLLIVLVFSGRPSVPPSRAQAAIHETAAHEDYVKSVSNLLKNFPNLLLLLTYGINTGSYYAISTLLNQVVLSEFPGEEENVGRIGLTIVISGLVGSVVCGIVLDKTKKFKLTTLVVYVLSFAGMIAFTFTLKLQKIWIVFLMSGILGFFMTGYLPVGFEFAAEITYPESEATSSGLLNASAQAFGLVFTIAMGKFISKISVLSADLFLSSVLLGGVVITWFIKEDLRRQHADKLVQPEESKTQPPHEDNPAFAGDNSYIPDAYCTKM